MASLVGDGEIDPLTLEGLRDQLQEDAEWFVYQNHAMDSSNLGHLSFLQCGPSCTYRGAPKKMPDSHLGIGWRYLLVGKVNLETGEIEPLDGSTRVDQDGRQP